MSAIMGLTVEHTNTIEEFLEDLFRKIDIQEESQKGVSSEKYVREVFFYSLIREGKLDDLRKTLTRWREEEAVRLQKVSFRSALIELIEALGLARSYAMDGGISETVGYGIVEACSKRAYDARNVSELFAIWEAVCIEFTRRNSAGGKEKVRSYTMDRIETYIRTRLHFEINLDDIANYVEKSVSYISVLFKKEKGITLGLYIQKCRVEEAKNLLRYTNMSMRDIAKNLAFKTQSYFSQVFRRWTNQTPLQYRKSHKEDKRNLYGQDTDEIDLDELSLMDEEFDLNGEVEMDEEFDE